MYNAYNHKFTQIQCITITSNTITSIQRNRKRAQKKHKQNK